MNTVLKRSFLFSIVAVAAYFLTIFLTPYVILLVVKAGARSELNVPVYTDVITEKDRHVVLPNPDFLYVASGYNLLNGPVRISGRMPDSSYYSFSLYTANTKNYYIKNDRDTPEKEYAVILTHNKEDIKKYPQNEVIVSPTYIGAMLVRVLIDKTENIEQLKEVQRSFKVEELTSP